MQHATTATTATKSKRAYALASAFVAGLSAAALAACGEAKPSAADSGMASAGANHPNGVGGSSAGATSGAANMAGDSNHAGSSLGGGAAGTLNGAGNGESGSGASGSGASGGGASGGTSTAGGAAGAIGGNVGSAGAPSKPGTCPIELVGFATLQGGTQGGGNAVSTVVTTQAELRACATDTAARVCRVQGTLTFSPFEEIKVASRKTIIGVGSKAEIVMGGFFLGPGVSDVIIRNLTIRDSFIQGQYDEGGDEGGDRDGVQMDTAHNVWIDHCHFNHLGDGQIDSRKDTTLETVSWNILENHNKAFGIGWTENLSAQITIHHNWLKNTTQRNPSTDNVLRAHLFNNLMQSITSYGNYARGGTNMVLQNSVFVKVNDPHYYETGTLVATGNIYRETTGQKIATGSSFSFFDPADFYAYQLDAAADVETLLARCAGPREELGN